MVLDKVFEAFEKVEVLPRSDGQIDPRAYFLHRVRAIGRYGIFQPQQAKRFQFPGKLYYITNVVAPVTISSDTGVLANGFMNRADKPDHVIDFSITEVPIV